MKKAWILIFILFIYCGQLSGQTQGGILRTGFVFQVWSIETLNKPISEITLPIEVVYSLRENLNIQFNHSPAVSHFGSNSLSGLSDTWIRSTYAFSNKRALVSLGVGLPTGHTNLDTSEMSVSALLSQNAFKFRVPVFGQGLTFSAGIMYAYPLNDKVTFGGGLNYVYRGKFKYSKLISDRYDPGDQIGANLGFDYLILPRLRANMDIIISYYTADKLNNTKMFVSGLKFSTKLGMQYQTSFGYLWMRAYYRAKAKNETWNGQALVPDDKNYNTTIRELEAGSKIALSEILSILASGEIRSYIENDVQQGWVDIIGGGVGYELQMSKKLVINMGVKLFLGDGEFMNTIPNYSGFELNIGTQWKF